MARSVVKAVGVAENANLRYRARMEDRYVVQNPLVGGPQESCYLAVYDGHGGREAADYAAETLHKNLIVELQLLQGEETGAAEKALDAAFSATDSGMQLSVPQSCGTTAVVALITRPKVGAAGEGGAPCSTLHDGSVGMRTLHVANAGDARAVLCKDITGDTLLVERLSFDHKPGNPDERKRIEQAGGAVINQRVLGVLAVSRALGDHELKNLVTCKPHMLTTDLPSTAGILVLACDGVFDVMSDQECLEFVANKFKELSAPPPSDSKSEAGRDQYLATALARALVQEAIRRSTRDNVTAVVAIL